MELRNIYGQMAGSVESVLMCFGSVCASSVVPWHDRLDSTQGLQVSAVKRDGSHRKWHVLFAPRPLCASGRVTAGDVKVTIAVEMFTTHRSPHVSSYNRSICLSLKGIVHICVFFFSLMMLQTCMTFFCEIQKELLITDFLHSEWWPQWFSMNNGLHFCAFIT